MISWFLSLTLLNVQYFSDHMLPATDIENIIFKSIGNWKFLKNQFYSISFRSFNYSSSNHTSSNNSISSNKDWYVCCLKSEEIKENYHLILFWIKLKREAFNNKYFRLPLSDEARSERPERDLRLIWELYNTLEK